MQITQEILVKTIGSILSRAAQFLTAVIAARLVAPQDAGTIFYLIAIFSIFRVVFHLGLPRTLIFFRINEIGEIKEILFSYVIGACVWATFIISITYPIVYLFGHGHNPKPVTPSDYPFIMFASMIGMVWILFGYFYQAKHDTIRRTVFEDILSALGILISVTVACITDMRHFAIIFVTVLLLLSVIAYVSIDDPNLKVCRPTIVTFVKGLSHSRAIYFISLVGLIFSATDTVFLMHLSNQEEVARYAIAARVAILANLLTASLEAVILPYAANLNPESLKSRFAYTKIYDEALWAAGSKSLLIISTIVIISPLVIVIFGPEYKSALGPLGILLLGWGFAAILGPAGPTLTMVGLQKYGLLNAFVALIFNIGANLLLVSRFGAGGAAMSVTISIYILHGLDFNLAAKRAIVLSHMNSLKWLFIIYLSMAVSGYFYINYWIRK